MGIITAEEVVMEIEIEEDGINLKTPLPDRPLEQNAMPVGMI